MYALTIQYRLAGNLYENRYYLGQTVEAEAITAATAVFQAQRLVQTTDVEYVNVFITSQEAPYATIPLAIDGADVNGERTGGATGPALTFLVFTFRKTEGRGTVKHLIRGYEINVATDLGVFNALSAGRGDPDSDSANAGWSESYTQYLTAVSNNTVDPNGGDIQLEQRLSIGSKRAGRIL